MGSSLKKGTVVSYISIFVKSVVLILFTPVMIKLLGKSEYGLYQLAFTFIGYLGILSFGLSGSYMKFFAQSKQDSRNGNEGISVSHLNGLFLGLLIIISIISLLAGYVLIIKSDAIFKTGLTVQEMVEIKKLMSILVFNIAISFPSSLFTAYALAHERFVFIYVLDILESIFNPFLTLPLLLMGYKSIAVVSVIFILSLLKFFASVYYCFKTLGIKIVFTFSKNTLFYFKDISYFSIFLFINIVTDQLNWHIDKFIIGRICDTSQVAVYSIGAQINYYFILLPSALSNMFIPRINMYVAQGVGMDQISELFIRVGRLIAYLIFYILIGFIFLGNVFIQLWVGDGFEGAFYVSILLMGSAVMELLQKLGDEIQKAFYKHKFRAILYFIVSIVNVIITIPLTKYHGICGAAFGTSLSIILASVIMNFYNKYKIGLNTKKFWIQIWKVLPSLLFVASFVFGMLYIFSVHSWVGLCVVGAVYSIVYFLSIWFLSFNQYEKELLGKPIRFLLSKVRNI